MVSVNSSALTKRITIMQPTGGQDPNTGDALPPTAFATVWAEIKPMSGSELYRAQQFVQEATMMVTIRFLAGVQAKMTVQYKAQTFEILYPLNEMEADAQLNLLCKVINQ